VARNFGFRLISITQRPAKLHKDVLTQLSTLVALGVTSPQDRDAVKAWVDGNADREQARVVYDSLARLAVGEGWIWAPDHEILERVKFPPIKTLDTSKTPKAGDARITAPVLAEADLAKIAKQIAAIEAAQSKPPAKADKTPRLSLVPLPARPAKGAKVAKQTKSLRAGGASDLGAAIISARMAAGLSQIGLAERLKTSQSNIVRLEKGRSLPSSRTLQKIAKATGHELVISFVPKATGKKSA
jgi:ribosome-binding protein aMBF1 (putative translation factor)